MTTSATTVYNATRITYDSARSFEETQAKFDDAIPLLEPAVTFDLYVRGASWKEVEDAVNATAGPLGLVAVARITQGLLLSLNGEPLEATLYLVGNPVWARQVLTYSATAALYAPFRVAIFSDDLGTHLSYDQPSTVFASIGSPGIDEIARDLDAKIAAAAEVACHVGQADTLL